MPKVELLAPAGNLEVLKVAVDAGCDAVYLGGKNFGARSYANNFTDDELLEAIKYAHLRQVKVYVTINTIVFDKEWPQLHSYLELLTRLKVDAVIVQDLGVLDYIRQNFTQMVVHASTQMNVTNPSAAKFLQQLGVKRVILARETPLDVVKEIVDLGIEVEVFCHGALCFSYSGNCLMSYLIGGRSGNRGECAQPCRKKYRLLENGVSLSDFKALLSMKDLNTLAHIQELMSIGVTSLKIEGRMKSPEYVYTSVKAYRAAVNGQDLSEYDKKLKVTFNREFTSGYLFNMPNNELTNIFAVNHQGVKIGKVIQLDFGKVTILLNDSLRVGDAIRILNKEEVGFLVTKMTVHHEVVNQAESGETVTVYTNSTIISKGDVVKTIDCSITKEIEEHVNINHVLHVRGYFRATIGSKMSLLLECNDVKVDVETEMLLEEAMKPLDNDRIRDQLIKTNDPLLVVDNLKIDYDRKAFFKISDLNQIRRLAINKLLDVMLDSYQVGTDNDEYKLKACPQNNSKNESECVLEAVVQTIEQGKMCLQKGIKMVFAPFYDPNFAFYSDRVSRLGDNCPPKAMIHSLDKISPQAVISPYLNIANRQALKFMEKMQVDAVYLSPEVKIDEIDQLDLPTINIPVGYAVYGRLDMMVTKHCFIAKAKNMKTTNCLVCQHNSYELQDDYQNQMPVLAGCKNDIPELRILSYRNMNNLMMIDKLKRLGIKRFLLIFTIETPEEVEKILSRIKLNND